LVTCQCEPTTWETPVTTFPAPAPAAPYNEARSVVGNGPGIDTFAEAFGGTDANGRWSLYVRDDNGTALPAEVVVGMIAGGWGIEFFGPTAANVTLSGRVTTAEGNGLRNARVTISGDSLSRPITTTTGAFGYYQFEGLEAGQTYLVTVGSKRFTFQAPSRVITMVDNVSDFDFVAVSP
ncbi:MAG TPA: carboxypeptidase-like regulatory domain-containing protein, partial [Pyrinomonadaceae bacterium]|nr:carboxypeptidase-like regulatory domain-containing protein [Pyrinomonadaceae bacterium]